MQEDNQETFCYNPGKESTTMRIQGGGEEIQGPSKKTDNIEEVSWELNYVTWKVIQGPLIKIKTGIQTLQIMLKEMNPGSPIKKKERIQRPQFKMEKKNPGPTNKDAWKDPGPTNKDAGQES